MREEAAKKLHQVTILDGHFLSIPVYNRVDGFVASYALHHLTYQEKVAAIRYLDTFLAPKGRIVIADTMYSSLDYKQELHQDVERSGSVNLLQDLQTEFFELLEDITNIFVNLGYTYEKMQMNKYVWIIAAQKGGNTHA